MSALIQLRLDNSKFLYHQEIRHYMQGYSQRIRLQTSNIVIWIEDSKIKVLITSKRGILTNHKYILSWCTYLFHLDP